MDNYVIYLIVSALAVWRITHMIIKENGLFDIFTKFKSFLLSKFKRKDGGIVQLFTCFWCLSMWISALFAIPLTHNLVEFTTVTLALSAVAIFIEKIK